MAYDTITAALEDISFPQDRRTLIEQIGTREVEIDVGKTVTLRELLNACTEDRYETANDVVSCPYITQTLERRKIG